MARQEEVIVFNDEQEEDYWILVGELNDFLLVYAVTVEVDII